MKENILYAYHIEIEEIEEHKDDYIRELNEIAINNNYDIVCLFVTDIIENGSYVYFNEKARNIISLSFNVPEIEEGHFLKDIVSRKKQMIVAILEVLERK